jgi:hypothetical protein
MPERHFPPRWSVEELDSCFAVKDANGQALAYMYFEKESLRRFRREELLTRDEAQRIATVFAKLPELLGDPKKGKGSLIQFRLRSISESLYSVSGRSNIAEANVSPCPSMVLS